MKNFADYNPIALFVYFLAAAGIAMFTLHPLLLLPSLIGSLLLFGIRHPHAPFREHLLPLLLFCAAALINPIVSHNGVTVLFVVNDSPVTLESLFYGIAAAVMIVSVLYWFRSFSSIMTSDKLLYLFGTFSPKTALLLSMTLRYIPLFRDQAARVDQAGRAMSLYREDNFPDTIRGKLRVFSVMVTWALENGIITADSMTARGYGTTRRSFFAIYRFRRSDTLLIVLTGLLTTLTIVGMANGSLAFTYYPAVRMGAFSCWTVVSAVSYTLLSVLPALITITEVCQWKFLQSKI